MQHDTRGLLSMANRGPGTNGSLSSNSQNSLQNDVFTISDFSCFFFSLSLSFRISILHHIRQTFSPGQCQHNIWKVRPSSFSFRRFDIVQIQ
jgi:hypothetical protein